MNSTTKTFLDEMCKKIEDKVLKDLKDQITKLVTEKLDMLLDEHIITKSDYNEYRESLGLKKIVKHSKPLFSDNGCGTSVVRSNC